MRRIRVGRVTAVCVAVVVAVSAGAAGLDWRGLAGLDRSGPDRAGMARSTEAPDQGSALRAARAQGSRVEVADLRTETRTVYAEPDGTTKVELTARPVRVKRADGAWSTVDTTLVRRADGTVGPRAAVVDLAFSGGGVKAPLVRYGKQGTWIALSWPGRLPVPTLSGNTATYPEVLPGVDLRLEADVDGYAQFLVVKNREAAANPAVRAVRLGLRGSGLSVRATSEGGLEARDGKGAVVYSAPVSRMWDAGTPRREATVDVRVEKNALVLRPDRSLLSGASTRYPVTVDPVWHPAAKLAWTSVLSGNPDTEYPNSSGAPPWAQVGQCYVASGECNGIGLAHTYWMFDTSIIAGRILMGARLGLTAVNSPNCETRTHQVYLANAAIHNGTNWLNKPGGLGHVDFAAPATCAGRAEVGIDVAGLVNHGGTSTFLVQPADQNDQIAWRRYDNNATLSLTVNRVPDVPSNLWTDPTMTPCHWCGGVPYLGDDSVQLKATLTDPDGDQVQSVWQVKTGGAALPLVESAFQNNGFPHSHTVNTTDWHGKAVEWAVKGEDTAQHGGGWAQGRTFVVDRQPPTVAPTVGATPYQADNRWHGGVGVPGKFVLGAAGVADVDHYLWGWEQDPNNKVVASALGGHAVVTLTPPGDGPRVLVVRSVDRAGHRGPETRHRFYVRAGSGPLAQWSLDGNAQDEAFLGDRHGVVQGGVTYAPGAVGQAARFDGTTGHVTAPYTVRTDASFAVSAWAKLDSGGAARAVVSQNGTNLPGFVLWYRPDNGGRWVFGMPKSTSTHQGTDLAISAQPAQVGVWTHVAGVYDAATRKLRLYVDGVLAGTGDRTVADWVVGGQVQIGRTMWESSAGTDHWPGLIDEVKIYDRVLSADEVRAAVGADNVQVGHWMFDELSGTTASNEVDGGEKAVLHGDAAFTGDSDGDKVADGGAVGGAVRLDGAGDHVTTSGPAVHTNQSFTVGAWVQLEQAPGAGQFLGALSQDGANISGFFLGYRQRASGGGVWEFTTPGADASPSPSGGAGVQSASAELNTPTHLAAVYDAGARQIQLYVNGLLSASGSRVDGFDATGPLAVGRGFNGGPGGYWKGWVDEVRAYSRALSEAELRAVVSRDNVALGQWRLDGNTEATGNGGSGVPHGTPTWTAGQSDAPDPSDFAVRLSGDDHVSLPHTVDVTKSFAVAAWAKLDRVGTTMTVLSQDGRNASAFQLMAMPDGRWAFGMHGTDATDSTQSRVDGPEAQIGVWTHLVGVYDAAAGRLTLHVNGAPAGTAQAHRQTWNHADGGMQIGAGWWQSSRLNHLVGAVDDVAVYGRVLFAEEIKVMSGRDLTLAHNWRLDEGSGTNAADAVGRRAATATGGVTRVPGRLGNAVALNGTDGRLSTGGVDVPTDADFTVGAWVRLPKTCERGNQWECKLTAVSLDGGAGRTSKFRLGHWRDGDQNGDGVWVFEMPEADGTITKAAVPTLPADFGKWVHLAGVYDRASGTLWLYVNGTRRGDGTLQAAWPATGGLHIGRGLERDGSAGQYFSGLVDDVRVYSGALDNKRISTLYKSYPVQCVAANGEPAACALPTADKGHWRFDDNAGTTAEDSSGRGLTATLSGGATWTGGRIGKAGQFNGADGHAATAGPVLATSQSFAVSAWVAAGATNPTKNQVILAQSGGQASAFYLFRHPDSRWGAAVSAADAAAPALTSVLSTERVWPGQWTHLGLVYDDGLNQLRLYVNGRLSAAQTGVTTWEQDAAGPLTIGQGLGAGSAFFQGAIDDVRAYGTALRDGELSKVYDDTSPAMLGNWTFDDQTVRDSSWRNNPTTTTGPISYVDGAKGKAFVLDGRTSAATTQYPGVVPLGSLTVSAWAKLTHEPAVQTVVAQDGERVSGFALQYRPELDTWVFGTWVQDAEGVEFIYARAIGVVALGEWTHLTGVYDHAAAELRVYVNGQLAGALSGVTLWPATGGLSIGRGLVSDAAAQHFTGQIDEVRVDLGIVPDTEIAQRATRA